MTKMNKTVAERLREFDTTKNPCSAMRVARLLDFEQETLDRCAGKACAECKREHYDKLADAIEAEQAELRERVDECNNTFIDLAALELLCEKLECGDAYHRATAEQIRKAMKPMKPQLPEGIEWPRFADGELVKFGDEIQHDGEAKKVSKVSFYKTRTWIRVATETYYEDCEYLPNEPFKRPESEVLDADGVPIKVGDTVYHEVDGSELTVVGFRDEKEDGEVMVDVEGKWFCVRQFSLTHRKPDTFESVVGEMMADWDASEGGMVMDGYFARFRKLMGGE